MKNIFLFLALIFTLWACKKKENPFVPGPASGPGSSKCMLTEVERVRQYGNNETIEYFYDEHFKLIRQYTFQEGSLDHYTFFEYNSQGELSMMLISWHNTGEDADTIATYEFEKGLLTKVVYHNSSPNPSSTSTYEYNYKGFLRKIYATDELNNSEMNVITDDNGNPIQLSLIRFNGKVPDKKVEYEIRYDDKRNPFYHFPGMIQEWLYFAKNNVLELIVREDGKITSPSTVITYFYRDDQLIEKEFNENGFSSDTLYYHYSCDQ